LLSTSEKRNGGRKLMEDGVMKCWSKLISITIVDIQLLEENKLQELVEGEL
jgi:hypothetical protein